MSLIKRKECSDKIQAIKVYPRIRPMSDTERECKAHNVLDVGETTISLKNMNSVKKYSFDHVFHNNTTQQELYDIVVSPMIYEVLNGFSCTVFAYGQTGTGKTFTMAGGSPEESCWKQDRRAGVIPRALAQLFELLAEREANVRVSYIELYNEEIIDLLSDEDPTSRIRLYDDQKQKGSVIIQGAEEVTVRDKNEVYALLDKGMCKRQTATTLMNVSSSRSHTVFIITVHSREVSAGEEMVKIGKLYLVDLAGSENIAKSGATEKRARETAMINQSLLTLGRVIHALIGNNSHVPYRESKLTRILQDSLGGRSKTSLIITVSPASNNLEETINTLEYGSRARNIHNRPEVNQRMSKTLLITSYVEEIEKLKKDLAACRTKDGVFMHADNYERMMEEKRQNADELLNRINEIKSFQERIDLLNTQRSELERNFSLTESALQHSQSKLDYCKSDLLEVKKKNKIRDIYIKKVCDIEDRYEDSITVLQEFARKTYDNECYLYKKMEKCYEVFVENFEKGRHALNESEEMKSELSTNVHRYANKITVDINKNASDNNQNNEDIKNCISDFKKNINDKCGVINQSQETLLKMSSEILRLSADHNTAHAERQRALMQHLVSLNSNIATLQEHFTSSSDVLQKLRELNDSQFVINQANSRLQLNDVDVHCKQVMDNAQNKLDNRTNDLKAVEEESKANRIWLEDGHKRASNLKERFRVFMSDLETIDSIYNTTLYHCDKQDKAIEVIKSNYDEETEFWKKFTQSSQHDMKNNIERTMKIRQQSIEDLNPEFEVLLSECQKSSNLMTEYKELSNIEIDQMISQTTESEDELIEDIKIIVGEIESEIKITSEKSDDTMKEVSDLLENLSPLLELNDVKQTVDQIHEMTNSFDKKLPELVNRFEQFINRDMKRVNPTGDTPVKAVLKELPNEKRIPAQVIKSLASKVDKYDKCHVDSFLDQENINPDVSVLLDSSLLSQSIIEDDETIPENDTKNTEDADSSIILLE